MPVYYSILIARMFYCHLSTHVTIDCCCKLICALTLKHPVTWQLSADGGTWIGHMILKKTILEGGGEKGDSSAILGKGLLLS